MRLGLNVRVAVEEKLEEIVGISFGIESQVDELPIQAAAHEVGDGFAGLTQLEMPLGEALQHGGVELVLPAQVGDGNGALLVQVVDEASFGLGQRAGADAEEVPPERDAAFGVAGEPLDVGHAEQGLHDNLACQRVGHVMDGPPRVLVQVAQQPGAGDIR